MTTNNPFMAAEKVAKKLKVLIYGPAGTGKTRAALTFPRPAVVDSEGGTDLYAGRDGVPAFAVMRAKSMDELNAAIAFIQQDKGRTFDTLVIDPITVFYDVQKEAMIVALVKAGKKDELTYREWGKINARMTALYNTLTNLPVHVVVIARESALYANDTANLKVVGTKPEADKKIEYMFDFVIKTRKGMSAEVIKSRGVGLGSEMKTVTWDAFALAAGMFDAGQSVLQQGEDVAASRDAQAFADNERLTASRMLRSPGQQAAHEAQQVMLSLNDPEKWPNFLKWCKDKFALDEARVMDVVSASITNGVIPRTTAMARTLAFASLYDIETVKANAAELKLPQDVIDEAVFLCN